MHVNDAVDPLGFNDPGPTARAYDQIKTDILVGLLHPGMRLSADSLCSRYGGAGPVVCEALSRLEAEDWIVADDSAGFCVTPLSEASLLELTRTRVEIEGLAITLAIEIGNTQWEAGVHRAFQRLHRCSPSPDESCELHRQWGEVHRQFHESLLAGCMSHSLLCLTGLLFDKFERYRCITGFREETMRRDIRTEHKALMDAALQRNAALARQLIADHFQESANSLMRAGLLSTNPQGKRANGQPPEPAGNDARVTAPHAGAVDSGPSCVEGRTDTRITTKTS